MPIQARLGITFPRIGVLLRLDSAARSLRLCHVEEGDALLLSQEPVGLQQRQEGRRGRLASDALAAWEVRLAERRKGA